MEDYHKEDCSVPPDLVKKLGSEAAEVMHSKLHEHKWVGEEWWKHGLPLFVKQTLEELRLARKYHKEDVEL